MNFNHEVRAIAGQFQLGGDFVRAEPFGSGHINDTFRVTTGHGLRNRYILQRLNPVVFPNPAAVMENIRRVTAHLDRKIAGAPDAARRVLRVIPALDGNPFYRDAAGHWWRVYYFVERTRAVDVVESPAQAFAAAQAFGQFQKLLADLPAPRLHDTIPDFHHTPSRFAALEKAVAADAFNRAQPAAAEIEFARRNQALCRVLLDARLPERVTHNDTKINNVLLDDATGEGVCVIDLDTVMPGCTLYDFGVRGAAARLSLGGGFSHAGGEEPASRGWPAHHLRAGAAFPDRLSGWRHLFQDWAGGGKPRPLPRAVQIT